MSKFLKLISVSVSLFMLLCAVFPSALAQSNTFSASGTVVNLKQETVISPYGGTVKAVLVNAGEHVNKGDPLITFATTGVYAPQDGTAYVLGEVGDNAQEFSSDSGAVAYVEPANIYTISASTRYAHNNDTNRIIHPGEAVYLRGANITLKGEGRVTKVNGTSFTVEVTSGNFKSGDSVYVFRSPDYKNINCIGGGRIAIRPHSTLKAEGIIVNVNVKQGTPVKKGDLLFETLSGKFTGAKGDLKTLRAERSGVINTISVSPGSSLTTGGAVCTFYPDEWMRVKAKISESDLGRVRIGDPVSVKFSFIDRGNYSVEGTIESVSAVSIESNSSSGDKEGQYNMFVRLADSTNVLYGMSAIVTYGSNTGIDTNEDISQKPAESIDNKTEPSGSGEKPESPVSGEPSVPDIKPD